ncbi:hypothetical protein YC2023_093445 [Brassica napus]
MISFWATIPSSIKALPLTMLFPKALAFVVSCLLNVQPFVISCLRSFTDREVEMRTLRKLIGDILITIFGLVKNLALSIVDYDSNLQKDLRRSFGQFGPLKDINLPRDYYSGYPRGFGFVEFEDRDDAAEAKYQMDGNLLLGRELSVVFAEDKRKKPTEMRAGQRGALDLVTTLARLGLLVLLLPLDVVVIIILLPLQDIITQGKKDMIGGGGGGGGARPEEALAVARAETGVRALGEEEGATHLYQRVETGVQDLGDEDATHLYQREETGVRAIGEEGATHLYQREVAQPTWGAVVEGWVTYREVIRDSVRVRPKHGERSGGDCRRGTAMRGRSYTLSPSPPRGHGRRGRSPSPSPRGGGRYRARSSLFVCQLSRDCREGDLRKSFKQFGPLKDIHLPRDHRTGGYHIANYSSTEACVVKWLHLRGFGIEGVVPLVTTLARLCLLVLLLLIEDVTQGLCLNSTTTHLKEGYDRRRRSYSRSPASNGSRGRSASPATSKSRSISRSPRRSISRSPRRRSISRSPRRNKSSSLRRRRSNTPIPASRNRSRRPRRIRSKTPVPPARSRSPRGEQ